MRPSLSPNNTPRSTPPPSVIQSFVPSWGHNPVGVGPRGSLSLKVQGSSIRGIHVIRGLFISFLFFCPSFFCRIIPQRQRHRGAFLDCPNYRFLETVQRTGASLPIIPTASSRKTLTASKAAKRLSKSPALPKLAKLPQTCAPQVHRSCSATLNSLVFPGWPLRLSGSSCCWPVVAPSIPTISNWNRLYPRPSSRLVK